MYYICFKLKFISTYLFYIDYFYCQTNTNKNERKTAFI